MENEIEKNSSNLPKQDENASYRFCSHIKGLFLNNFINKSTISYYDMISLEKVSFSLKLEKLYKQKRKGIVI